MRKTNWDADDDSPKCNKKGRKPSPPSERAKQDLNKGRNKFFKF